MPFPPKTHIRDSRLCDQRDQMDQMATPDIEDIARRCGAALSITFARPSEDDVRRYAPLVKSILAAGGPIPEAELARLRRSHGFSGKRSFLLQVYMALKESGSVDTTNEAFLKKTLQTKAGKSWSGIVSITVFTSPRPSYTDTDGSIKTQAFSCEWSCSYCPNEPGQPRSYLMGEPAVLRANKNAFDCAAQVWDRMDTLFNIGHPVDKIELIVSGGTWTSYPAQYREEFCRDAYYAANTWGSQARQRMPLQREMSANQSAQCRIVGLTIETRPDTVTPQELVSMRRLGVTRVQLGVQHTDDGILELVNRRCTVAQAAAAIRLLKENCFKVDCHYMPNLPGSSPKKDKDMLVHGLFGLKAPIKRHTVYKPRGWAAWLRGLPREPLEHWEEYSLEMPDLSFDQAKIYPTAVTPWTDIERWFKDGSYVPYGEKELTDILVDALSVAYPWVRLNRIIRDIPAYYMYNRNTGADNGCLRQEVSALMESEGLFCMDIRNREVRSRAWDGTYNLFVRRYDASGGTEHFISAESVDSRVLYGFVRLRLSGDSDPRAFPELKGAALVRELHVYGGVTAVGNAASHVQHRGLGRALMARAEGLAAEGGYKKAAVIAAEGNKEYYRKLGYVHGEHYCIKYL